MAGPMARAEAMLHGQMMVPVADACARVTPTTDSAAIAATFAWHRRQAALAHEPSPGKEHRQRRHGLLAQRAEQGNHWQPRPPSRLKGARQRHHGQRLGGVDQTGQVEVGDGEVQQIEERGRQRHARIASGRFRHLRQQEGCAGHERGIHDEQRQQGGVGRAGVSLEHQVDGTRETGYEHAPFVHAAVVDRLTRHQAEVAARVQVADHAGVEALHTGIAKAE